MVTGIHIFLGIQKYLRSSEAKRAFAIVSHNISYGKGSRRSERACRFRKRNGRSFTRGGHTRPYTGTHTRATDN